MDFMSRTLGAGLSKQCTIKKNIEGACGVWSGDETITPKGFRNIDAWTVGIAKLSQNKLWILLTDRIISVIVHVEQNNNIVLPFGNS